MFTTQLSSCITFLYFVTSVQASRKLNFCNDNSQFQSNNEIRVRRKQKNNDKPTSSIPNYMLNKLYENSEIFPNVQKEQKKYIYLYRKN